MPEYHACVALGGINATQGGNGGDGGYRTVAPTPGNSVNLNDHAGGGGGGSVGVIRFNVQGMCTRDPNAQISPPQSNGVTACP